MHPPSDDEQMRTSTPGVLEANESGNSAESVVSCTKGNEKVGCHKWPVVPVHGIRASHDLFPILHIPYICTVLFLLSFAFIESVPFYRYILSDLSVFNQRCGVGVTGDRILCCLCLREWWLSISIASTSRSNVLLHLFHETEGL